ncbi:hypothetical protein [Thomasclavelia cocleata]|nr:hypothetical protein [Thomasclavelia cocleata]
MNFLIFSNRKTRILLVATGVESSGFGLIALIICALEEVDTLLGR